MMIMSLHDPPIDDSNPGLTSVSIPKGEPLKLQLIANSDNCAAIYSLIDTLKLILYHQNDLGSKWAFLQK